MLEIRRKYGTLGGSATRSGIVLFRGQSDAEWPLRTTLERFSSKAWTIEDYAYVAHNCAPQIETYLERSFDIPEWPKIEAEIRTASRVVPRVPIYPLWVYLRQHEFPSPLLDWTASPFVAAFFAFEERMTGVDHVAVYAFIDRVNSTKAITSGSPQVTTMGPYVRADRRHFAQQSWYTIATRQQNGAHVIVPHESGFVSPPAGEQDILLKITLPRTQRIDALRALHDYNITRYTLFQSEDALVRTLAFEEIEEKQL